MGTDQDEWPARPCNGPAERLIMNARFNELLGRTRLAWSILRSKDHNTVRHAQAETAYLLRSKEDGPDRWMARALVDLTRVFSAQGHSGFSAGWCISAVTQLLKFEPLGPLMGEEDEWCVLDYGGDMKAQNKRCSRVFRRQDGTAYDIDAVVFREPDGSCFTGAHSRADITFPYTPTTVYADVAADAPDADKYVAAQRALGRAKESTSQAAPADALDADGVLLNVIQRLNQNPYSLTKSECITVVSEMRDAAIAAQAAQKNGGT